MIFQTQQGQSAYDELKANIASEFSKVEEDLGPEITEQARYSILISKLAAQREALAVANSIDLEWAKHNISHVRPTGYESTNLN